LPKFLTESEMTELFTAPHNYDPNQYSRDRSLLELIYSSGLRRSEVASLNVGDVDYMAGTVRVFGKGSKERIVPVGNGALTCLRDYLKRRNGPEDSAPMFLNTQGARLTDGGIV